jgi:hypothetical protein
MLRWNEARMIEKFEDWKFHLKFRYMVDDGSHKSERIEHGGRVVVE